MRLPCKCKTLATSTGSTYLLPIIRVYPFVQQASNHPSIIKLKVKALVSCRGNQRFGRCDEWMNAHLFIAWPSNKHREFTEGRCFSCFTFFFSRIFPSKQIQTTKPMVTMVPSSPATQTPLGAMLRWRSWALASASSLRNTKLSKNHRSWPTDLTFWSDLCWQISVRNSWGFVDTS